MGQNIPWKQRGNSTIDKMIMNLLISFVPCEIEVKSIFIVTAFHTLDHALIPERIELYFTVESQVCIYQVPHLKTGHNIHTAGTANALLITATKLN